LSLEWKLATGTNSGIIYRCDLLGPQTYHTGPEYQILERGLYESLLAKGDVHGPVQKTGALYDLVPPAQDVEKPNGEWNVTRIVVRGWRIEHWLNGVKIVEADLASAAGRELIAGSKFKTMPKFATLARGHLALQDHDETVSFRNVKLRELKN